MTDWTELKDLQAVAAAQARQDHIECDVERRGNWQKWNGHLWDDEWLFRSRPAKKTKTIVLREALMFNGQWHYVTLLEDTDAVRRLSYFVKWLDTPEIIVEVDCEN